MKKKNLVPFLLLAASLVMSSCNTTSNSSSSTDGGASSSSVGDESSSSSDPTCKDDGGGSTITDQTSKDVSLPKTPDSFTAPTVLIHYRRSDATYTGWKLWLWCGSAAGADYAFNYQDNFGVVAAYPLSTFTGCETSGLSFIVKKGEWEAKDPDGDRKIDFSTLTKTDNKYEIWLMSGSADIYTTATLEKNDIINTARFTDSKTISYEANKKISEITVKEGESTIKTQTGLCVSKGLVSLTADADVTKSYTITLKFVTSGKSITSNILINALYKTDAFNSAFTYNGELGAIYTSTKTTFKVWSPISSDIKLRLYNKGSAAEEASPYKEVSLSKGEKGVWSYEESGDLAGKYYTYVVSNASFTNKEIVDPYAKSAGANGVRGMIVDFSKTNPDGWDSVTPIAYDRKQLAVWETHVADATSSSTWGGSAANSKKYLGLVEEGTTHTSSKYSKTVKTGFDHIKELGVNAVQLQPIFDSANDELNPTFNWGYNPLNYNCLDGSYSSDPEDGYARIKEFKTVVSKFNAAGINIIMDVVYNHVSGLTGSNFDVLMPGYYFRYNSDGTASNGSGCGNETASELPMFRKFMEDSTAFWAKEYKLGGFRFDLMGLHDLTTMDELTANLKKINSSICVYGEPWTGGTTTLTSSEQANQANGNSFVGYGAFNDGMRDALIKGGLHASSERGWVTMSSKDETSSSDVSQIKNGLKGFTDNNGVLIADPDKTVNYVTCHDNYTLRDRIYVSGGISSVSDAMAKTSVLANSFVFTSQGTSFMLAGDEFSRTKGLDSNSYESSYAVNALDYELKARFYDEFEGYQKLIALKTSVDGLHLGKSDVSSLGFESIDGGETIKNTFKDATNSKEYVVYHVNGSTNTAKTNIDLSGYTTLYYDSFGLARTGSFKPNAYEVVIASKAL
jgi:pullulanase